MHFYAIDIPKHGLDANTMSDTLMLHLIYGTGNATCFIGYLYVRRWKLGKRSLIYGSVLLATTIFVVWWYAIALISPVLDYHNQTYYFYASNIFDLFVMIFLGLMFIAVMYVDSLFRIRRFPKMARQPLIRNSSSSAPGP